MSIQTKIARASQAYDDAAMATATLGFGDRNVALNAVARAAGMNHGFDERGFWLSTKNGIYAGRPVFCIFR